jgi:hypothetical protein
MGYYTNYSLEVKYTDDAGVVISDNRILEPLYVIEERLTQEIAAASGYTSPFKESIKWYDHEQELLSISKKYTNVLLILSGEGEEPGDLWKKYFWNGTVKVAKAKINFDEWTGGYT